jgi:hypothetical protein
MTRSKPHQIRPALDVTPEMNAFLRRHDGYTAKGGEHIMKRVYYKSKWTLKDLDEKTVQFTLTGPKFRTEGIGVFRVHIQGELVSIDIVVEHPKEGFDNLHHLFETSLADKIEPHTDESVPDFRLLV